MGRPGRVGDRIHGTDNKIDERGRRVAPYPTEPLRRPSNRPESFRVVYEKREA